MPDIADALLEWRDQRMLLLSWVLDRDLIPVEGSGADDLLIEHMGRDHRVIAESLIALKADDEPTDIITLCSVLPDDVGTYSLTLLAP